MPYSFVIPTRERHDVLGASIRSVLAQSRDNFELIVVDDARLWPEFAARSRNLEAQGDRARCR